MIQNAREELLECLAEECAEVIKAKSKMVRFGVTPDRKLHLKQEMADIMAVIAMIAEEEQWTEADQIEMLEMGEASMKKRDSFMTHKPRVRHQ